MENIQQALKKYFGYDSFRPMQADIIQHVMSGKDSVVLMPTGGGKSICYQIPAIVSEGTCVVISPLISLMQDQVNSLLANGIPAAFWNSTLSPQQAEQVENDFFNNKIKLLYVSPEKVVSQAFLTLMRGTKVSLIAVDEAHCISSWGHDFRPEYTQMQFLKRDFPNIPLLALTATADKLTRKDIVEQLHLHEPAVFISSFDRPNLSLSVRAGQKRMEQMLEFIGERKNQSGIIYCLSRKSTEEVADKLKKQGIKAEYYHAMIPSHERARIQNEFINDKIPVICATVAFGMGIDKPNVRWVIHYNLPKNVEGYYQEIGRAGRDGSKSDTLLFYSRADANALREMLGKSDNEANKELQMAKLDRMLQYAEALICRRKILLNYFGETMEHDCGNCDVCQNPPKSFDGTIIAQKVLSAVFRCNQQIGMGLVIDVLRGSARQEIIEKGFNNIKTYGAGRDQTFAEWQFYILQLLNLGLVDIAYDQHHVLKLTSLSQEVLFNGKKVDLVQVAVHKKEMESRQADSKPKSKKVALQEQLFELLRQLRRRMAEQRGLPAYQIFNDITLEEMAQKMPTNEAAIAAIGGMSERKLHLYGTPFLQAIVDFVKEKTTNEGVYIAGSTYILTYEMYKKGMTIEQIAKERTLNPVTICSHLAYLYEKGENIDLKKFVNKEEVSKVLDVIKLMEEPFKLTEIFTALNEQIEYPKIRFALAYYNKKIKKG